MNGKENTDFKKILETALKMLIHDGYSTINIKILSKEIGCSTQPLVWHFENMDGLRDILAEYGLKVSRESASLFIKNTMIYTHGLACFVASGVITSSKEEVIQMVNQNVRTLLL